MQSALVYKLSNLFLKAGASQFDNINEFLYGHDKQSFYLTYDFFNK